MIIKINDFSLLRCMNFLLQKGFVSSGNFPALISVWLWMNIDIHSFLSKTLCEEEEKTRWKIWLPYFFGSDDMLISKAQMHICPSGVTLIKALWQMMRVYQNEILWPSEMNMIWPCIWDVWFSELRVYEI